jgi:polyisoprenyl-phosphate glycosyltransferase
MKLITVVTPCFNEDQNIKQCYLEVKNIFSDIGNYCYEHIFIDNSSTDSTYELLLDIASKDNKVKLIQNSRNFGHLRSPFYGILQSKGDATILFAADLQDPANMIPKFIKEWEQGGKSIVAVKRSSGESHLMFFIRKLYYRVVNSLADIQLIDNFTGFGLYDKEVVSILRNIKEPYPYFRGMIAEIGLDVIKVEYDQPARVKGITKNNFYSLYDVGMLGIVSHSKVPLRLATMTGFVLAIVNLFIASLYLIAKLVFWDTFEVGIAPIIIGLFFFFSMTLFFIGIVGEYVGFLYDKVQNRPLVVERNRVNFD